MGTVSEIRPKGESGPYVAGPCRCFKCKYEWVGVAPVGTVNMQCPQCECQGVRIGLVCTSKDQWQCACGGFVFRVDTDGPYCIECGTHAAGWFK